MYREYLTARSPVRMLEKGLHGGLGPGNLGIVLAGHGVGKSSFLVGVALDALMRDRHVLHVGFDQSVAHVRAYYDTVFDDLSSQSHLDNSATVHAEADRNRSIRAYSSDGFTSAKLRDAIKVEAEVGEKPAVVILDSVEPTTIPVRELRDLKALAVELDGEFWLGVACPDETVTGLPEALTEAERDVSVILALEPGADGVALRALKDHDNPDVSALHVALDPKTLLLIRS